MAQKYKKQWLPHFLNKMANKITKYDVKIKQNGVKIIQENGLKILQ